MAMTMQNKILYMEGITHPIGMSLMMFINLKLKQEDYLAIPAAHWSEGEYSTGIRAWMMMINQHLPGFAGMHVLSCHGLKHY